MARVSNSSTFRGWLESTGLDDILLTTCVCLFGPEELPPAATREQQPYNDGTNGARQVTCPRAFLIYLSNLKVKQKYPTIWI